MEQCFDHILLDAPCSGEGTIRKDQNALKNWSIASNHAIADVQKQLIESAFYALKEGGTLVYSTCTLTPVENQAVCQFLLEKFAGHIDVMPLDNLFANAAKCSTPEGYLHIWPQLFDTEGFFVAKFKKKNHVTQPNPKTKQGNFPFQAASKKRVDDFNHILSSHFAMAPLDGCLMERDQTLWLFPENFSTICEKIKFSRIGIQLGKIHKNGIRLSHEFATCYGINASKNRYSLSDSEAIEYFQGKDIKLPHLIDEKGEVLLLLNETCVGFGKWQKNKIKNGLPRELVRDNALITWV
jgi:16S rRNA (cytosine1407-C5)-methyltransferase